MLMKSPATYTSRTLSGEVVTDILEGYGRESASRARGSSRRQPKMPSADFGIVSARRGFYPNAT